MFKKIFFSILILLLSSSSLLSSSDLFIKITVDDQIITNFDIQKEKRYLIILNPKLDDLSEKKTLEIAKNSLVNEIIKKKELEKFFDLNQNISILEQIKKDLYSKLGLKDEKEFYNLLKNKKTYSVEEINNKLKIEILWNEFIYKKYKDQVKINENQLKKKIEDEINEYLKDYYLSEIFFKKEKNENLNKKIEKIKSSINEVGFNNTASIYSISESANYGGKIGWILESNLSKQIAKELKKINKGEYTNAIKIGNNFLFLKIENIKLKKKSNDKRAQLKEMKIFETNRQLSLYSNIYFNKIKINFSINEK